MRVLNHLLIKPAGPDCAMACTYCFYRHKGVMFGGVPVHRMSDEILEETLRQFLEQSRGPLAVSWQGGEPSLMGIDFFQRAVNLEEMHGEGQIIGNGFQTGGLGIDRAWARFFKRFRFLVGLSLDGTEHVHDRYRLDLAGRGTWSRVTDRAKLLLDEGVSVNAVATLNRYSAPYAAESYLFFRELGFDHLQFIPVVEWDESGQVLPFSVTPLDFGDALIALFDLWWNDYTQGNGVSVRYFESLLQVYLRQAPGECSLSERCGGYLVVEHDGSVYPCDFYVEDEKRIGNVLTHRLDDMFNSGPVIEFGTSKGYLPARCRSCPWIRLCQGGCPRERLRESGAKKESYLCEGYRNFFTHADGRFRELAATFFKGRRW